jgi:serine/threonine protein kinase
MKPVKSSNQLKKPNVTPVASFNDKALHDPANFMPSGLRVSDWCFNGQLDSSPPVVKVNEVYESLRPLGRGAFGDVYLVKNIDDNKL